MGKTANKKNRFEDKGDYVIGYTVESNEPFYVDKEDYDKIKDTTWYKRSGFIGDKQGRQLKRLVTDEKYSFLRHINGNFMDCRKANLTSSIVKIKKTKEAFSPIASLSSTSNSVTTSSPVDRVSGVWPYFVYSRTTQSVNCYWRIFVRINDKWKHLGTNKNELQAVKEKLYAEMYFENKGYLDEHEINKEQIKMYDIENMIPSEKLLKRLKKMEEKLHV